MMGVSLGRSESAPNRCQTQNEVKQILGESGGSRFPGKEQAWHVPGTPGRGKVCLGDCPRGWPRADFMEGSSWVVPGK